MLAEGRNTFSPFGKQILLDDPAGNCIELFEPPKR